MRTTNYNLPNAQYNRTYYAITIELPNTGYDLTDATITMHVKTKIDGKIVKEFSSLTNGGITKSGVNNYTFTINQHTCALPSGEYLYDILIENINGDGTKKSYIAGNWIVEDTITYKA